MRSRGWEALLEFLSMKTWGESGRQEGGHSTYFISPHMPDGRSKLASDGRLSRSLVSQLEQRQWHTWPWTTLVNRGHLFCEPQWFSVSGTNSEEPNKKRYFRVRQCQKQSSAALDWRRRGCGLQGERGGQQGSCTEPLIAELCTKGSTFTTQRLFTSWDLWPHWRSAEHQRCMGLVSWSMPKKQFRGVISQGGNY